MPTSKSGINAIRFEQNKVFSRVSSRDAQKRHHGSVRGHKIDAFDFRGVPMIPTEGGKKMEGQW
jgi:hypothetical protein